MTAYLAKRLAIAAATLVLASVVVFAVLEVVPGDPARLMLGMNASAEQVEQLRTQMGLNDPLLLRYLHWAGGILRLDFGRSYTYSVPVIDLVRERVIVSLPLALIALALSTAIALPVGLYAASRHGRMGDTLAMGATQFGVAVPNFWFALLLVYLFAVWLRWVPAGGFPGWSAGVGPALKALALPAVALALPQAAILAVGSVQQVPVVRDGEIAVGSVMKLTLSADHRALDGAEVAQFLGTVKKYLQNPVLLSVA